MNQNSFSPKARWDRFEPDKAGFNPDALNERIDVLVYFRHAKIFPKSFTWNNKEYQIFIYEGAGPAFNNDSSPDRYNEKAAKLAWSRTVAFFKEKLK